ncbi:hypothetical protein [Sphingobium sp.]|uniref:hypothetical protein n=1 Tax=Sphingobium sp. TaxID=1912891 RepID=UPI0026379962|nr:hypothetical protein [Sphingobium sp.]
MTETTSIPTVAQLEAQQAALTAQQAELDRQMAAASLGSVQAAKAVLDRAASVKVADDLEPLLEQLPANSMARQQIMNVINVNRGVRDLLGREVTRLEALAAEPVVEDEAA